MYNTILVPLDGSKRAEKILPHVEALAQKFGSTLVLLRVVEPFPAEVAPYDMIPHFDAELIDRWMVEARTYLNGLQCEFQAKGIEAKTIAESGSVVPSIIDSVERENVDLIAMASHGHTGLARVFYGSVAAGILNQVERPLLLIRSQD